MIDLVLILKDSDDTIVVPEFGQLESSPVAVFDRLSVKVTGMVTVGDIEIIGEQLSDNSTAAILLIENH